MKIISRLSEAIEILNEVDAYGKTLNNELSNCDLRICDLMHYIENNSLKTAQCYRIVKELRELRVHRRAIKNDMELLSVYHTNLQKLLNDNTRVFLLSEMGKKEKSLNSVYKNRVYGEEELKDLIGV